MVKFTVQTKVSDFIAARIACLKICPVYRSFFHLFPRSLLVDRAIGSWVHRLHGVYRLVEQVRSFERAYCARSLRHVACFCLVQLHALDVLYAREREERKKKKGRKKILMKINYSKIKNFE